MARVHLIGMLPELLPIGRSAGHIPQGGGHRENQGPEGEIGSPCWPWFPQGEVANVGPKKENSGSGEQCTVPEVCVQ